ncbi:hypothetical protein LOTGIDRAFT_238433 [Lottia gigantea]|uniref:Multivesicular body subunit 12A n=1 Tax=Lottia gigantea TaxID=225164 RepID=V4B4I6_LOTGI|nr:hypothetical protein LOTGIDRAFT_238433 [Lottia gigantea]ESP00867.1 hypothetical protein LOTGIDRAFT_238433 [Lottia gigantea]
MELDLPITGVCIVSDPTKCPPNYTLIDKTYGSIPEDADLWKDRMWGRKVTRYLCVERGYSDQAKNVLVDVAIINEKDPVPPGFTVVDPTYDTREKAIKKKVLCVRWMDKSMTLEIITELILLGKNVRKPPQTFTLVGELNGLCICYKMGRLAPPVNNVNEVKTTNINHYQNTTIDVCFESDLKTTSNFILLFYPIYQVIIEQNMRSKLGSSLPYPINPAATTSAPSIKPAGGESSTAQVHALGGVPWQLNPKLQSIADLKNIVIPQIPYKSLYDVSIQYEYDFNIERSIVSGK